jgi:hypothetical protein
VERAIDRGTYHPAHVAMRMITLGVAMLGGGTLLVLFRR